MLLSLPQLLTAFIVAAPLGAFAFSGLLWLFGWNPREKTVARISAAVYSSAAAAVAGLFVTMQMSGNWQTVVPLGTWFRAGEYEFPLVLLADRLSIPLMALTVLLVGLIGSFSVRYLHRDPGYLRFFLLLHLFGFAALLAFTAGSLDLLIGGWELIGLTSVLLIAFFYGRKEPVQNAIRVFATYRIADIGLLVGVFVLHNAAGSASCRTLFRGDWPTQGTVLDPNAAALAGILFVIAACGKSAQVPFSGWLPRAMEGPTPSSAIFYGAISVHMGAYLLLRIQPILEAAPLVQAATVAVGLVTAIHATMSGRVATDAKTSLAYSSMAQVGIIFAEAGMGWGWIALIHTVSHAVVRTLQFLRAPSMLHDYHRVHAAAGGQIPKTGLHYEALLAPGVRSWLYRFALDRGHLDTIIDRFVVGPVLKAARMLAQLEAGTPTAPAGKVGVEKHRSLASSREIARSIDA
jgi:NAD(P)H-quinone oxidoreductase subunit 5